MSYPHTSNTSSTRGFEWEPTSSLRRRIRLIPANTQLCKNRARVPTSIFDMEDRCHHRERIPESLPDPCGHSQPSESITMDDVRLGPDGRISVEDAFRRSMVEEVGPDRG